MDGSVGDAGDGGDWDSGGTGFDPADFQPRVWADGIQNSSFFGCPVDEGNRGVYALLVKER